jgi:hypothetical protein
MVLVSCLTRLRVSRLAPHGLTRLALTVSRIELSEECRCVWAVVSVFVITHLTQLPTHHHRSLPLHSLPPLPLPLQQPLLAGRRQLF